MSKPPRLSIVMPTYNQSALIEQAIESVLRQTAAAEVELIIIDAKSTDTTAAIIESLRPRLESELAGFRYISEPDRGQSDGFNKGIRFASAPLIGCLCSDDYFEPNVLDRVLRAFQEHPEARWGYAGWQFVNYDRGIYQTIKPPPFNAARLKDYDTIGMPSCFFTKEFVFQVGGFREELHLSMDYDLWLRMLKVCPPIVMSFIASNMRYYGQTKSGSRTFAHLKENLRVQKEHTHGSITRLRQYLFYARGWVVIALRRDLTHRVERARQSADH